MSSRQVEPKEDSVHEALSAFYLEHHALIWSVVVAFGLLIGLVCGLYFNILQRRRIEATLRCSERNYSELNRQLQTLLNGIPDHLMLVASDRSLLWMNRAAQNFAGPSEPPGQVFPCYRQWRQSAAPCGECPVARCFASGQTQEAMIQVAERTFGVKAFPICGEKGQVESVIKLAIDITDKVRLRAENDRENRLAAVGTLAAGVAHEINNPAGLILSNLEIVSEAVNDIAPLLDEQYRTVGDFPLGGLPFSRMRAELPVLLRETGDAARRIRQTVADLKDFSRGDAMQEFAAFPLRAAIERSVRLTDYLLRKATAAFAIEHDPRPIQLHGSQRRIEQVLVNLLANACQALPDRSRAIVLKTRYDDERRVAVLLVRDDGIGIPPENLPKLATPFFTTRQAHGGTGLGLSVSFGIVKEHGGTIHFASEAGKGTTVTVTLPATLQEQSP